MIQRLNSYNLLTDKVSRKSVEQFTDQLKKSYKSTEKLEINFREKTILTAVKYKSCLSFRGSQKNIVEFTNSTYATY